MTVSYKYAEYSGYVDQIDVGLSIAPLPNKKSPSKSKKSAVQANHGSAVSLSDEIADIVHKVENFKKDEAFSHLKDLDETRARSKFELGGVLSVILDHPEWYGGAKFNKWVAENTSMKGAQARKLIANYTAIANCELTAESVKGIHWTKLYAVSSVLTKDNADHWLEIARTLTRKEIDALVKTEKGKTGANDAPVDTMKLVFFEGQKELFVNAIEKAKAHAGTEADSKALELICLDYLAGSDPVAFLQHLGPDALADRLGKVIDGLEPDEAQKVYEALGAKVLQKVNAV